MLFIHFICKFWSAECIFTYNNAVISVQLPQTEAGDEKAGAEPSRVRPYITDTGSSDHIFITGASDEWLAAAERDNRTYQSRVLWLQWVLWVQGAGTLMSTHNNKGVLYIPCSKKAVILRYVKGKG